MENIESTTIKELRQSGQIVWKMTAYTYFKMERDCKRKSNGIGFRRNIINRKLRDITVTSLVRKLKTKNFGFQHFQFQLGFNVF